MGEEICDTVYNEDFMNVAFEEAEMAQKEEEVPIGCCFVKDGEVVARGRNRTNVDFNGCAHAEVVAINELYATHPETAAETLKDSILYVTVEPCIMCTAALLYNKISFVYCGCLNDRFGGCGGVRTVNVDNPMYNLQTSPGHQKERAITLLRGFYETENTNCPEGKRRKKLGGE